MEEEMEILELYEVSHSDLMLMSSSECDLSSSSPADPKRLQAIRREIMETLGPTGPGLLSITGVPNASFLRRQLLPLARKLALVSPEQRKHILKEHGLGSDVPLKNPDRTVSCFAMQLKYAQSCKSAHAKLHNYMNPCRFDSGTDRMTEDDEFKNLETAFKCLGFCMMELGLCIARICDREIGGQELEQSLLESCAAKGRLIHYHSAIDNLVLREAGKTKQFSKRIEIRKAGPREPFINEKTPLKNDGGKNYKEIGQSGIQFNLWQQWHYDYGIFTVLTDPMFLLSRSANYQFSDSTSQECVSPSEHSYLQIYHPSKHKVLMVKTPPESFIIQVGESADILTKGKLCSTLHCVRRPQQLENISRETFVLFLQPAWSKTFSFSDYTSEHLKSGHTSEANLDELARQIQKILPPLSSRLKDGITFAEFSRETTKQYYGGSGLQSNK